jgi:regulatory protein
MSDVDFSELAAINPADIRVAAMDLLARREHSRRELKQKLTKRFKDEGLVEEQLERLTEENLQSDARFAESFLRQRLSRGHGPIRIRQEMRQRGISDAEIGAAMEAETPNWYELAEHTFLRKFGSAPAGDIKEKARRSRFMQYRGFPLDYYQHLIV